MRYRLQLSALLMAALTLFVPSALAQSPSGSIAGTVTDSSGGVLPNTPLAVTNKTTGAVRNITTGADGAYNMPALPAGQFEVRVAVQGFRTMVREATVETGSTTTVDFQLQLGATKDVVTVEAASAQIAYESHAIDGVITRERIQELPLNGRSFLNLAALEPGVSVSAGSTSQYNALFSVSILGGASNQTSITVDGGSVRNPIEGGSGTNFSQEVVQEFQVSSVNFDLSTSITSVGGVNAVTRQGGNAYHGSAYMFFRDHNMAAYPSLKRDPLNPDPFFVRRNPGAWLGGPIKKEKLFFFFNIEKINQVQAVTVTPNLPSLAIFQGAFGNPYKGTQLGARFDYTLNTKNQLFARYSHDGNSSFGPSGGGAPLSNWLHNNNWSDQSMLGWTSSISSTIVNDFRFSYHYWHNRNLFPESGDCSSCLGLGFPSTSIYNSNITVGNTSNATQGRDLRRFQFIDGLSWQRGSHRIRVGGEVELAIGTGFWGYCDPGCTQVMPPEVVAASLGAAGASLIPILFPKLPKTITSNADLLNLPFLGAVVGIGDPSQPPPYNLDQAKFAGRYRIYAQDTWRVNSKLTLNYGLGWNFETTLVNRDIPKPQYLAPLYGSDLSATNNNYKNFQPSIGFAYTPFNDRKTVIRGGFGIYYGTEVLYRRLQERSYLGPVGNGRVQYPSTGFVNSLGRSITNLSTGGVIKPGDNLQNGLLTMTLADWNTIYAAQAPAIAAALAPKDLTNISVRNIDISKSAAQLYPKDYPVSQSLQFSLGVQREVMRDLVINADFVRRVANHTLLGELDMNRYNRYINGVQSPIIPICKGNQASIVGFSCSTGSITFWEPASRNTYNALLVKADKRLSNRYQFTVSYALQDGHGYNGVYNMDHWNSSWGPQQARHTLSISSVIELPFGVQLGLISSNGSKGPYQLTVGNTDLSGSGITTSLIPGLSPNCINRGCSSADVTQAINNWNSTLAGTKDGRGTTIPKLVTASDYSFGRSFNSQDIRLTKKFTFREKYKFSVFTEMFNVLNYANLGGYGTDPSQATQFGVPTSRAGQVFGSGGPRALQVGGRFTF